MTGVQTCALPISRTYAPVIKKILDKLRKQIHGMIHCSGGAQTKILHFLSEDLKVIKDNMFEIPPLFKTIQEESQTDWAEMYKVFNMGHRMELYVAPDIAQEIIEISKTFNIDAKIVGRVEDRQDSTSRLTIQSEFGEFNY